MKKLFSLILCFLFTLTLCSCDLFSLRRDYTVNGEAKLTVHFIDVGQGDSILLESKGEFVLVDAGEREYGDRVVDYIEERGASSLKYVIATHPHSDHIGGMKTVLECIDTENFITSETDQSTKTWLNVLKAVDEYDINYIDAEAGDTYSFGEASFEILAPLGSSYNGYNNYSVVIKAVCDDISFLLTGDAEKESENEMLYSGEDLSADVLKCGHHGSSTSTSDSFLWAVNPAFAVISCGKDNEYGHPHRETVSKLNKSEIETFRTDLLGTIVAVTDGQGLKFFTQNGEELAYEATLSSSDSNIAAPTSSSSSCIGNKNSKVFHTPDCGGVKTMSEKNKVFFDSREAAIESGYTPCSQCHP